MGGVDDEDDLKDNVLKLREFDDIPKYSIDMDSNYSILINKLISDSVKEIQSVWGDEWHAIYILLFPGDMQSTRVLSLEGEYRDAGVVSSTVLQLFSRFPNAYSIKVVLAPGTEVTLINKN